MGCLLMMQASKSLAQCSGGRFVNQIFTSGVTTVTYSDTFGLTMDIYQPDGDVMTNRPLVILAHGGSFIGGDKTADKTVDSLCTRLARKGYVTASINYRLSNLFSMLSADSTLPIDEVIKAVSDGKAAIRYFRKDASTTNTYRIDTNNIFVGGNSAGAVLYMHVAYLDSLGECPSYIQSSMIANGGFDGNSGNAGYSTRVTGVIDLAGGLNKVAFASAGNPPSVNVQGDLDNVVPYTCGYPNLGSSTAPLNVHVQLCGLGSLEAQFTSEGIYHMSKVYPGAGHVPWDSEPAKFKTVDSLVTVFLYNYVCPGSVLSSNEVHANIDLVLSPNPATEYLNLNSSLPVSDVVVYDETGRVATQVSNINNTKYEINTSRLAKGLYFVKVKFTDVANTPVVKRIVVE